MNCVAAIKDDPHKDSAHQPFTAANQGYDAAKLGFSLRDNPYSSKPEKRWWELGFNEYKIQNSPQLGADC